MHARDADAALFNLEYERWLGDHSKVVAQLRAAAEEHRPDGELRAYADEAASHYGALMGLKARLAAADPLHLLSGLWKGAAERCFLWIGGFRPSELIKVAVRHAEPLTEPQAMGVCGVQQWAREAEAALDHELQAMHRSVSEAVSSDAAALLCPYSDVPGYMATMSLAISKLASLEAFVRQADALRLQALHRLPQILTARQSARCFLAIADYSHRLRALSELWHTRPRHEPPVTTAAAGSSHGPPYQSRDGLL
jgi:transcription factor TGA